MGRVVTKLVLGLSVFVALASCGQDEEQELIEQGRDVYTNNCARCHQPEGEGFEPVYPPMDDNAIVTLHDPDPVIDIVLEGRGGMPGFRDSLDPEERAQVISYIRDAWGNDASPVTPTQVK